MTSSSSAVRSTQRWVTRAGPRGPTSRPDAIHALVPPSTFVVSTPSRPWASTNSHARRLRGARVADHVRRAVAAEGLEVVGHRRQRDRDRPGDVAGRVLVRLAHVDHPGAGGQAFGELVDVDLGHGHGANVPSHRLGGRQVPGRVDVAQVGGLDGDGDRPHRLDQPVHGPHAGGPVPLDDRPGPAGATSASAGCSRSVARHDDVGVRRRGGRGEEAADRSGRSKARSQAATTTSSSGSRASAVRTPPPGPSPGHRSSCTGRPNRASRAASPPTKTTGAQPAASSARGHALGHRHAADLDERLVRAHPAAAATTEHGTGGHDAVRRTRRGRAGRGTWRCARPRRARRSPRPSRRARRAHAGTRGSSAPTSARSPNRASRWPAGRRGRGGSRRGSRRSARCRRGRRRRARPRRRGSAGGEPPTAAIAARRRSRSSTARARVELARAAPDRAPGGRSTAARGTSRSAVRRSSPRRVRAGRRTVPYRPGMPPSSACPPAVGDMTTV